MPSPSHRITNISEGDQEGWEVYLKAVDMIRSGEDVLMLSIGDHDFPTPVETINAAKKALDDGHTKYTTMQGLPDLLKAMAKVSTQALNMPVTTNEVVTMAGGQSGLYAAMQACVNPGEHVIIVSPHYVTYPGTVRSAGADFTLVSCSPDNGFEPRPEDIEAAIKPNTKAILINTPNNPTCAIYSRETLEAVGDVCIKHDLWIISDEVYWSLSNGKHISPRALPGLKERTIVLISMSKSHVMTGWRMGWIVAEPDMVHNFMQHNLVNSYGISDFISRAAAEALENEYGVGELQDLFTKRGAIFREALTGANDIRILNEDGGMYFMIDIRSITMDAEKFAFALLEQEKLCVMPGDSFGPSAAGHIRISLCQPEEKLREGATRLKQFISTFSN